MPTNQNPLKASPGSNYALIEAWLNDLAETLTYQQYTRLVLEPIELNSNSEKSYTVDTLSSLSNPQDTWVLLVGSDSAENLNKWKDYKKLLSLLSEVWIIPRSTSSLEKASTLLKTEDPHLKIQVLNSVAEISSSEIRLDSQSLASSASSQTLEKFISPHVLAVWKSLAL